MLVDAMTVVVLGGTGSIGFHISKVFLTEYRSIFPVVKVTTRDSSSVKARALSALGAQLVDFNAPLLEILKDAEVVINALSGRISNDLKTSVIAVVATSNAKVYFHSEYGIDYSLVDFSGFEHPLWKSKQELQGLARKTFARTKSIALYTGVFREVLCSPFATATGIDIANNTYKIYGPPSIRTAYTSEADIGRSVARLSMLALDPTSASRIPDRPLRITGDCLSVEDIAAAVIRVKGGPTAKIECEPVEGVMKSLQEALPEEREQLWLDYIRAAMGAGALDFAKENDNELVNPGESLWKWDTVEDLLRLGMPS